MEELVSIVIPTYNHAQFIGETIQSVIDQTYTNWECIVVNNFSEDNTVEVVESFGDSRIRITNFRNNGIIAASRNWGIKASNGNYIAFLDSDDIWEKEKLEKQTNILNRHKSIQLVATNIKYIPPSSWNPLKLLGKGELHLRTNKIISFKRLIFLNLIANSSVMLRKNIIEKIGYFNEDFKLMFVEDYDYWLRILYQYNNSVYLLKDVLLTYRIHGGSIRNNTDPLKLYKKDLDILNKYETQFPRLITYAKSKLANRNYAKLLYSNKITVIKFHRLPEIFFLDKHFTIVKYYIHKILFFLKNLL